jgi:Rad3-related DNA helicase
LNHLCKQLKKCPKRTTFQANQPGYDIEELKALGQHTCPYYFSKSLAPNCDVVCTPYQLLIEDLDKLEDAIVVVDEAHNFGPALLQAKSASLSLAHIIRTAHGLSNYKAKYQHRIKAKTLYYVSTLLKLA